MVGLRMNFSLNQIFISFTEAATAVFGAYFKLQSFIFMPVMGYLLNLTFYEPQFALWSLYPMTPLLLLGGMLIFLAICRPARETMQRKFFI